MAVLNSKCARFYFKKVFNSVKVLRSHIERIPIPMIKKAAQDEIIAIVDTILQADDESVIKKHYEKLDCIIADLYGLSADDYSIVKASMQGENLFL